MLTINGLVEEAGIPVERKNDVKDALHRLGYNLSNEVGDAFLNMAKEGMLHEAMLVADANAILATVASHRARQQDKQYKDISDIVVLNNLWNIPEPTLPSTAAEVKDWLFDHTLLKLPVVPGYYHTARPGQSLTTQKCLTSVEGWAVIVIRFTDLLCRQPTAPAQDEGAVAHLMSLSMQGIWSQLDKFCPCPIHPQILSNSSERATNTTSQTTEARTGPDKLVIVGQRTVLIGEEEQDDLMSAYRDLLAKQCDLPAALYHDVRFILAYAATGTEFQWYIMHDVAARGFEAVGSRLNLLSYNGWCEFLLTWVQAYRLLAVMSRHFGSAHSNLCLYALRERDNCSLKMLGDEILKKIPDFNRHKTRQSTSFEAIQRAYRVANAAANSQRFPFLITSTRGPTLRNNCYRVHTAPCGYDAHVLNEQDLHALAETCCLAVKELHHHNIVHRDIRLPNVVQLGKQQFMVIDLESVDILPGQPLPPDMLHPCAQESLDSERRFTAASDMHMIGQLLSWAAPRSISEQASTFMSQLLSKALTADQAVHFLQSQWRPPSQISTKC